MAKPSTKKVNRSKVNLPAEEIAKINQKITGNDRG